MKVILPSNGLLGTKWVDMREPNFGDLRGTISSTADDYLFKLEFVSKLAEFDFNKVTMDDVEYMYDIAAAAVAFNTLKYSITCPKCGKQITDEFVFGTDDIPIVTLNKKSGKCKKTVGGVDYCYHILSASDGQDIHTYALDDDEHDKMVEDATVCKVLGKDITDDNIEWVSTIPVSIYVSCFLFIKANRHGMVLRKDTKCNCGEILSVHLTLDSSWVKTDIPSFIAQYAQIRDFLDFNSFLTFTVPEFKNFVDYLNAEARNNE